MIESVRIDVVAHDADFCAHSSTSISLFSHQGTNIYFVGMMGTGKSTVARAVADVMGRYIFLDTDTIIEELLGASVGEVFATDGEEAFRSVESQVLDQVSPDVSLVTLHRAKSLRHEALVDVIVASQNISMVLVGEVAV